MKLNLGCGQKLKKGYVNVDIQKTQKNVIVYNLEKYPWPWKDNSVDEIFMQHFFEHVADLERFMKELKRVCRKKARVKVIVPYFSNPGSFSDPTHKRYVSYTTFDYYSEIYKIKVYRKRLFFLTSSGFMKSRPLSIIFDALINLSPKIYQRFFPYIFPCAELHVEFGF